MLKKFSQDNQRLIRIPVAVETDWRVTGTSKPSQVEYNITQEIPDKYKFEEELGEEVIHVYAINNPGPSTIQEAEVFILWPSFNENKDHLLYLLDVDRGESDRVTCERIENINPLYVKTFGARGYAAAATGTSSSSSSSSGRFSGGSSSWSSSSGSSSGSSHRYEGSMSGGGRGQGSASASGREEGVGE